MGKNFGRGEDTRGLKAKSQKAASAAEKGRARKAEKERKVAAEWREGSNSREQERQKAERLKAEETLRKKALKHAAAREDAAMLGSVKTSKAAKKKIKKGGKEDVLAGLGDLSFMTKGMKSKFGSDGKKKTKKKTKKNKNTTSGDDGALRSGVGGGGGDGHGHHRTGAREMSADEELAAAGLHRNTNHERARAVANGDVEATGLDAALGALSSTDTQKVDHHPERRMKAAMAAYIEQELPILQQKNPGLKRTQLLAKLHKQFDKSPENPLNQHKEQLARKARGR